MSVTYGNFALTSEQSRFAALLSRAPFLVPYWNFQTCECNAEALKQSLPAMSHGEKILTTFFGQLWGLNDLTFSFDVMDAVATLDEEHIAIINDWLKDPFFP